MKAIRALGVARRKAGSEEEARPLPGHQAGGAPVAMGRCQTGSETAALEASLPPRHHLSIASPPPPLRLLYLRMPRRQNVGCGGQTPVVEGRRLVEEEQHHPESDVPQN